MEEKFKGDCAMNGKTLDYYNQNATVFANSTMFVDFAQTQDKFLNRLHVGDYILDFGCGSGRDTKYFLAHGMSVDAVDGSEELCRIASAYTGIEVRNAFFGDLDEQEKYDGIWACASILHLSKEQLIPVMKKMIAALKPTGIIYTSFKYGTFEGERNGRYFTDFTEESFANFMQDIEGVLVEEQWITSDVRPGRGEEKWLNLIFRKKGI
jgi:2-polyprenyl-3-methyl-5-hydroxy-6-metoxy-1,4-benzoquinol methylase